MRAFLRNKKTRCAVGYIPGSTTGYGFERTYHRRRSQFLIVALCECHKPDPGWYWRQEIRRLAAAYYRALRKALIKNPELRQLLYRCADCQIFFLTYPSNPKSSGREVFRCPMGCQSHHRNTESSRRSTEYNRTPEGKQKKKELNARRSAGKEPPVEPEKPDSEGKDGRLVGYLKFILWRIDRRRVTAEEVQELLKAIYAFLRQHSLDNWWRAWQIGDG